MTKKVYKQKYFTNNQYREGNCLKGGGGGAWAVYWFKGGGLGKKEGGGCFWGRLYLNTH